MASQGIKSVEFEAGKMNFDQSSKKVTPDPRRGKVRVFINADGEKKFEWRDYQTDNVETDLYIFEFDAKFDKVAKSSGRIYYLHFDSYDEKFFFWMQEKDASKDDEICRKVNEFINDSGDAMETEPLTTQQIQTTQPAQPSTAGNREFSNLGQNQNTSAQDFSRLFTEAMKNIQSQGPRKPTPSLNDIMAPKYLETVLQDKDFHEKLIQHLPEKQQSPEGLRASIKSAQLQQAIDALDEALNSEEGMTVLMSLGFDPNAFAQAQDGTEALIIALEQWAKQSK